MYPVFQVQQYIVLGWRRNVLQPATPVLGVERFMDSLELRRYCAFEQMHELKKVFRDHIPGLIYRQYLARRRLGPLIPWDIEIRGINNGMSLGPNYRVAEFAVRAW